jgi:hypothetical protein
MRGCQIVENRSVDFHKCIADSLTSAEWAGWTTIGLAISSPALRRETQTAGGLGKHANQGPTWLICLPATVSWAMLIEGTFIPGSTVPGLAARQSIGTLYKRTSDGH